ncbi:MAG TPA: Maf family protein, partial [Anaeromyxobacteraceae bacterium]|nr:Maf family protein [Anaeromyxobacteraceae bacterium]
MLALRAPLVLASQSPRRRALLERLGLPFEVRPSAAAEVWP